MVKAIEVVNLTKKYDKAVALSEVSLSLEENKIYGLLGRNGAGKTTLMHLLAGQLIPTDGYIHIWNENVYENINALNKICFVGSSINLNKHMKTFKIRDIFKSAAMFYPNWDNDFASSLINLFSLDVKKRYRDLSAGMLSMVSIIISLASRAPVTLLDEPYSGLDATARQEFYDVLAEDYGRNPRTIIFSTHLIDEASKMFEDVILLDKGNVLFHQALEKIEESSFVVIGEEGVLSSMLSNKNVIHKEQLGGRATYALFDTISEEEKNNWFHSGLEIRNLTLQQLFVYLTAKRR